MGFSLRVHGGRFRGRRIPTPPHVRGQAQFTPAIVKEAVFQLAENRGLGEGTAFFDLFAGSGQMSLEALSRGYSPVHACEVDSGRFGHLRKVCRSYDSKVRLHARDCRRMAGPIRQAMEAGRILLFLDPPYSFWQGTTCPPIDRLLGSLRGPDAAAAGSIPPPEGQCQLIAIVQGPEAYAPPWGDVTDSEIHSYGRTILSIVGVSGSFADRTSISG